ncbi:MAG: hypothetical protein R2874_03055 [Desulfobacterales bacterium]
MTVDTNTYQVTCRTCRKKFSVQLFDTHEKNLFVVDKKDWYCDGCKKEYFAANIGFVRSPSAHRFFSA